MKIDWVWRVEFKGWFISIDGSFFGPMNYGDIWRLPAWLTRAAMLESDHDRQQRMIATFQKVRDVKRADWERLLSQAEIITPGNEHTCFKITTRTCL